MKLFGLIVAVALALGIVASVVAEEKKDETPAATQPTTQAAKVVNTKCPVSGDDVDPKGKTVTYKGKKIGFCCDDCIKDFNKNPEKYSKDLK